MPKPIRSNNPWDWLQPQDIERFGSVIEDSAERRRWCKATLIGGLPYLWRHKAPVFRDLVYTKLNLKPGATVFILGESNESCGFEEDIRNLIGSEGQISQVDIQERARTTTAAGVKGRGGRLGTWQYDYTTGHAEGSFDAVAVLQAVQHCDDWGETAIELTRVLKPGGAIVLTEIGVGGHLRQFAQLDLHIEYWMDKLYAGAGMNGPEDVSYYSPADLLSAFDGLIEDAGSFSWRGADLVWGIKRRR